MFFSQVPPSPLGLIGGGFNPHYELGDLGLVPRGDEYLMTNTDKMNFIQPQKELRALKKVTRKSVSTQTIDATKVKYLKF